jgi:hypothetical protein
MSRIHRILVPCCFIVCLLFVQSTVVAQDLPPRYPTLELFTNTPCPICANQNPGLFSRLANYEGQYHLIGFYPGKPYTSCVFYQSNTAENTARFQFYAGDIFGTPTVAINGIDFKSSNGVNNTVLADITGNTSWLNVDVNETSGSTRTVDITLQDHVGGSLTTGKLFAVIVEKEIQYNAPNGETLHHNVFRQFLTPTAGEDVDMSTGTATRSYSYEVDAEWAADQIYTIAWLMDPATKEIYNSGTKFDPDFVSAIGNIEAAPLLHLYPNPTQGQFTLSNPAKTESAHIEVFNSAGALIFSHTYPAQPDITLDGSLWPEGNYLVKLEAGSSVISGRISIVK